MRQISVFLDTSILKSLLKESSLSAPTRRFLELCKDGQTYALFYSLLSLHELLLSNSPAKVESLIEELNQHHARLLLHQGPREVDYLAINFKHLKNVSLNNEYDLYNLSLYAITSIECYLTWNVTELVKFHTKEILFRDYLMSGYHGPRFLDLQDPRYLLPKEEGHIEVTTADVIAQSSGRKIKIDSSSKYLYEEIQAWFTNQKDFEPLIEEVPGREVTANRAVKKAYDPMTEIVTVAKNFDAKIEAKEIPLLRFHAPAVGFDMDYNLFRLTVEEGAEVIAGILDDMLMHRPLMEETKLSKEDYRARKATELLNEMVPAIRSAIDSGDKTYPPFAAGDIQEFPTKNLDKELVNAFMALYKPYEVKREAIDFVESVFGPDLGNYRSFATFQKWTNLHDYGEGAVDSRKSFFIVDQAGQEIVVILMHCYID